MDESCASLRRCQRAGPEGELPIQLMSIGTVLAFWEINRLLRSSEAPRGQDRWRDTREATKAELNMPGGRRWKKGEKRP